MKLTKKKIQELQAEGKKAGLFEDLSLKEIEDLKLPYIKEGVIISFPEDIDKTVIESSIKNMQIGDSQFSLNTTIDKTSQWVGEIDNIKVLDDSSVICNMLIMDKTVAIYLEEGKGYELEPVLKFKGTKTKYFNFENFTLLKVESDPEMKIEEDVMEEKSEEYVTKTVYDQIVAEFELLKNETIKAISKFEENVGVLTNQVSTKNKLISTLNDKIKVLDKSIADKDMILKIKDDSIAKFQNKIKESEKAVAMFESQIKKEESEKKQARFDVIFKNYCSAHNISENEFEIKRKELSSLSEDSLEIIHKDSLRLTGNFSENEEIIENSQAPLKTVAVRKETSVEPNPREITDSLFEKLQKINNN